MKMKMDIITRTILESSDFQGVYSSHRLTPTRCELIDRKDINWWASSLITNTERNVIEKKIVCHINELIHLLGEMRRFAGIYSAEEGS